VRTARPDDVPAVVTMGGKFFAASPWRTVAAWDDASFAKTLRLLIEKPECGGLIVAEDEGRVIGMAGFLLFPSYFNFAALCGEEIFWWVEEGHRYGAGQMMLDAMEGAAKAKGAILFVMGCIAGMRSPALARLYERRGYRASDNRFVRRL
jgi:hypothetical protein